LDVPKYGLEMSVGTPVTNKEYILGRQLWGGGDKEN